MIIVVSLVERGLEGDRVEWSEKLSVVAVVTAAGGRGVVLVVIVALAAVEPVVVAVVAVATAIFAVNASPRPSRTMRTLGAHAEPDEALMYDSRYHPKSKHRRGTSSEC